MGVVPTPQVRKLRSPGIASLSMSLRASPRHDHGLVPFALSHYWLGGLRVVVTSPLGASLSLPAI